jgi:hypothetical protein
MELAVEESKGVQLRVMLSQCVLDCASSRLHSCGLL